MLPPHFRFQLVIVAFCAFLFLDAAAQNQPSYIQLSPTVKAVLYSPSSSSAAHVAVVNMHEDGNRLSDIACTELVKRGFYVLCMNGRSDNNEAMDFWNDLPTDVAVGVKYLRETLKVSKVLLYGGSGGAPLMTFYQNVAQNGPSVCQGPNKLIPCTNELAGLPRLTVSFCEMVIREPPSILCDPSIRPLSETTNRIKLLRHWIRSIRRMALTQSVRRNIRRNSGKSSLGRKPYG